MQVMLSHLISGSMAAIAIGLLAYLSSISLEFVWLMAPFGASAVLLFGLPNSPLARSKNLVFGHLLTAIIGLAAFYLLGDSPLIIGLATGLGISAMLMTNTTHPPAGANPILIILTQQDWGFLIFPVLIGTVSLIVLAKGMRYLHNKIAVFFTSGQSAG